MSTIIYVIVVIFATTIGAIAGLGGGVIIKPFFDALAIHSSSEIGFMSSCCVFAMCLVSIYKQLKQKNIHIHYSTAAYLSIGSVVGGLAGEKVFYLIKALLNNNEYFIKGIQAIALLFIIIIILWYTLNKANIISFRIKSKATVAFVGFFLGIVSIFLGIGGGPLNIALLTLLFSFSMKESVVYSIITIFFSQISKIGSVILSGNLFQYDLKTIAWLIPAAIFGGYIGTLLNKKYSNEKVEKIYIVILFGLILICIYNAIMNFRNI